MSGGENGGDVGDEWDGGEGGALLQDWGLSRNKGAGYCKTCNKGRTGGKIRGFWGKCGLSETRLQHGGRRAENQRKAGKNARLGRKTAVLGWFLCVLECFDCLPQWDTPNLIASLQIKELRQYFGIPGPQERCIFTALIGMGKYRNVRLSLFEYFTFSLLLSCEPSP